MNGFHRVNLGDILTLQRGFDITKNEQSNGGIPIISSSGISSYHNKWKVKGPGVVIGRKGTLGTVHFIRSNYWPHDTTLWIKDFKGNDPRFLSYFLQTLKLENFDVGASNPTLNRNHLHRIKIIFPEKVDTQKRIAAILSAYDDLIENNRRRIALLEKMAEETYREWFVRMRFPGHEKVKIIKGVPEGWRALPFTEICEFQKGKAPDQVFSEQQDSLLPYINVEFLEGQGTGYVQKKRNSVISENGDILMLMDGARSGLVFRGKRGVVGSTFARVAVEPLYRDVIYEFLVASREHIVSNNTGSAIPHANKEFIHRLIQFLPVNENLIAEFNVRYRGFLEQAQNLVRQNELLVHSRDALLPRLISGKLSVEHLDIQFPSSTVEELKTEAVHA
ncbi:MAG: restriction endonuclease subunit S [Nitrosospira sp.]|nr:restriction endonuclease subunit S [Nitrosospira sp.]